MACRTVLSVIVLCSLFKIFFLMLYSVIVVHSLLARWAAKRMAGRASDKAKKLNCDIVKHLVRLIQTGLATGTVFLYIKQFRQNTRLSRLGRLSYR